MTASPRLQEQEITEEITQLYRTKDRVNGMEWLFYNLSLIGEDYQGNRLSWDAVGGVCEDVPSFTLVRDPNTEKIISEKTQVRERKRMFSLQFSKEAVEEL